jgi:hypothetical protein
MLPNSFFVNMNTLCTCTVGKSSQKLYNFYKKITQRKQSPDGRKFAESGHSVKPDSETVPTSVAKSKEEFLSDFTFAKQNAFPCQRWRYKVSLCMYNMYIWLHRSVRKICTFLQSDKIFLN